MNFVYAQKTFAIPEVPTVEAPPQASPFTVFEEWFNTALTTIPEANAIAIATCMDSHPSNRIVYLRAWDETGFVFFTNTTSEKGQAIFANPEVEGLLYWREVWQQIRIRGRVELIEPEEADAYFAQRPRESQLGAWASLQSQPLADPHEIDRRHDQFDAQFAGEDVPRPAHWSGYRLIPTRFEFWQGLHARLHQRWLYSLEPEGRWSSTMLYP